MKRQSRAHMLDALCDSDGEGDNEVVVYWGKLKKKWYSLARLKFIAIMSRWCFRHRDIALESRCLLCCCGGDDDNCLCVYIVGEKDRDVINLWFRVIRRGRENSKKKVILIFNCIYAERREQKALETSRKKFFLLFFHSSTMLPHCMLDVACGNFILTTQTHYRQRDW